MATLLVLLKRGGIVGASVAAVGVASALVTVGPARRSGQSELTSGLLRGMTTVGSVQRYARSELREVPLGEYFDAGWSDPGSCSWLRRDTARVPAVAKGEASEEQTWAWVYHEPQLAGPFLLLSDFGGTSHFAAPSPTGHGSGEAVQGRVLEVALFGFHVACARWSTSFHYDQ